MRVHKTISDVPKTTAIDIWTPAATIPAAANPVPEDVAASSCCSDDDELVLTGTLISAFSVL